MGLPSKKRPKSEKRKRGITQKLQKINFSVCPRCKHPVLPHHLCSFCGTYQNREIITIKTKKTKKKGEKKEK